MSFSRWGHCSGDVLIVARGGNGGETPPLQRARAKSLVGSKRHRLQPELAGHSLALGVHVHGLGVIKTVEEKTVWARNVPDRRHRGAPPACYHENYGELYSARGGNARDLKTGAGRWVPGTGEIMKSEV